MAHPDLFGAEASVVLTDKHIRSLVESNVLVVKKTFDAALLEACSYDIRVGDLGIVGGTGRQIDLTAEGLELAPGGYAGIISWEKLKLPRDVFARLGSKRSYSYDGLILLTGSLVDPGYEGHLLFGLYNASQKRHVLRRGSKIASIVFEKLPREGDARVQINPDLMQGRIPDDFVNKLANMEVLPWSQISDRVRQVEEMASDILDLKQRYEDVLEPIKQLTHNVERVSQDVEKLAERTSDLGDGTRDNADQLRQVIANLATITSQVVAAKETAGRAEQLAIEDAGRLTNLAVKVGRFSLGMYVVWTLLALAIGAALPYLLRLVFG